MILSRFLAGKSNTNNGMFSPTSGQGHGTVICCLADGVHSACLIQVASAGLHICRVGFFPFYHVFCREAL